MHHYHAADHVEWALDYLGKYLGKAFSCEYSIWDDGNPKEMIKYFIVHTAAPVDELRGALVVAWNECWASTHPPPAPIKTVLDQEDLVEVPVNYQDPFDPDPTLTAYFYVYPELEDPPFLH